MSEPLCNQTLLIDLPFLERPYGPGEPDVFCYYDGPLLVRLPAQEGHEMLAMALPDIPGKAWPFLAFAVLPEQFQALLSDRCTLLHAVCQAQAHWLISDYGAVSRHLELEPLRFEDISEDWLPGDVFLYRKGRSA